MQKSTGFALAGFIALALVAGTGFSEENEPVVVIEPGSPEEQAADEKDVEVSLMFFEKHIGTAPLGEMDMDRVNVNGGAIALGHPVGASGARIVLHLARVLEQQNASNGIASLCIGGGQGGAMLLERSVA